MVGQSFDRVCVVSLLQRHLPSLFTMTDQVNKDAVKAGAKPEVEVEVEVETSSFQAEISQLMK